MMAARWELAAAAALDLLLADPRWMPHPVRGIGWMAAKLEIVCRALGLPLRAAGMVFWVCVVGITSSVVFASIPWLNVYWIWAFLALRSLDLESLAVIRLLSDGRVDAARVQLANIVGRDTASLTDAEILRAVIETVSENLNDGIIAPLFYLALAGPAGMGAYKAINTLDSIVGYKNNHFREFGWFSARADDIANIVPARIAAGLVWICATLLRFDARRSVLVTLRDAHLQPSPNSGYPEAAFAGALGVQLGGTSYYRGKPSCKAFLGDPLRPLSLHVFRQARVLLYSTSALMMAVVLTVLR